MCNITCLLCCIVPMIRHHSVNTVTGVALKFGLRELGEDLNSVKVLLDLGSIKKSPTLLGIEFLMSTPKVVISYGFYNKL